MAKARSRAQRRERHAARVERLRDRQGARRRQELAEDRYREAFRLYQNAQLQAMLAEYISLRGGDAYYEWVVCDKCGLLQVYVSDEGGEEDEIHELVYPCPGFESIGCGSETCISVSRYLEESA